MTSPVTSKNPATIVIIGTNYTNNIIYGDSSGNVSVNITTSYEIVGGAHAYNELVGDAQTISDYAHTVGNILIGGANSTNLLLGTAYYADGSSEGPNTGILTIGSNTITGGIN